MYYAGFLLNVTGPNRWFETYEAQAEPISSSTGTWDVNFANDTALAAYTVGLRAPPEARSAGLKRILGTAFAPAVASIHYFWTWEQHRKVLPATEDQFALLDEALSLARKIAIPS